jgi:BASS family bile acid:Na+ symporter
MAEVIQALSNIFTLIFVVASMAAMGLSLTVCQILEPLKNVSLVVRSLGVRVVWVPLLAYLIRAVIPMPDSYGVGLILLACCAGAPFLPKLVQMAKGDLPFGVGLMVMLMVITVVYAPLVLPILLPGVSVNPLDIASSLVVLMLIPLAIALFVRARYPAAAASAQPAFAQASNVGLLGVLVTMLLLNWRTLLSSIGSGALLAALLFVGISFVLGLVLGPTTTTRPVLGLGTAQRNVAAAMVVATGNFADDPDVLVMVLVGSVLMMIILLPLAGELGRRANRQTRRGSGPRVA